MEGRTQDGWIDVCLGRADARTARDACLEAVFLTEDFEEARSLWVHAKQYNRVLQWVARPGGEDSRPGLARDTGLEGPCARMDGLW